MYTENFKIFWKKFWNFSGKNSGKILEILWNSGSKSKYQKA